MLEGFSDFGVSCLSQRYGRACQGQARPGPGALSNSLVQVQVHGKAKQSKAKPSQAKPSQASKQGHVPGAYQVPSTYGFSPLLCSRVCCAASSSSLLVRAQTEQWRWVGGWREPERWMDACSAVAELAVPYSSRPDGGRGGDTGDGGVDQGVAEQTQLD